MKRQKVKRTNPKEDNESWIWHGLWHPFQYGFMFLNMLYENEVSLKTLDLSITTVKIVLS